MSTLYPRTFKFGSTGIFSWLAPEPIVTDIGVTLTVGAYSTAMGQYLADVNIVAGGVNTDRTVLTAAIAPAIGERGVARGDGWLLTDEGETFPVRVIRIDGTSILLANPLPIAAPLTGPSVLQFAAWAGPIGPGDVTAAVDYQGTEWSTSYRTKLPNVLTYSQGLVKVVRVVWQSGLSDASFVSAFPEFQNLGHRDASYQPQIDAMYAELANRIDTDVNAYTTTSGQRATVDDVASQNAGLQLVHGYMVAAKVAATRGDLETFQHYWTRAFGTESSVDQRRKTGLYADAMRPIWVDLDRDGIVDDGELEAVTGPGPGFVSSGFSAVPRVPVVRSR